MYLFTLLFTYCLWHQRLFIWLLHIYSKKKVVLNCTYKKENPHLRDFTYSTKPTSNPIICSTISSSSQTWLRDVYNFYKKVSWLFFFFFFSKKIVFVYSLSQYTHLHFLKYAFLVFVIVCSPYFFILTKMFPTKFSSIIFLKTNLPCLKYFNWKV